MSKQLRPTPEVRQFIKDLTLLKDRAGRLELFKTMHALDPAVECVGFEVAERLKKENPVMRMGKIAVGQLWASEEYGHFFLVMAIPHKQPHDFGIVTMCNLAWPITGALMNYDQRNILERYVMVGMAKDVVADIAEAREKHYKKAAK